MPRSLLWPDPRVKPPFGAAEVDQGHQLAQALQLFTPWTSIAAPNLVTGNPGTPDSNVEMRTQAIGAAPRVLTEYPNPQVGITVRPAAVTNVYTLFSVFALDDFSANAIGMIIDDDNFNTSRKFQFRVGNGTSLVIQFIPFNTAVGLVAPVTTATVSGGRQSAMATLASTGEATVYVNAGNSGSATLSGTPATPNSTLRILQSKSTTGANGFRGGPELSAYWTRALTQSEGLWLHAEPYAMLRPIVRRRYFVPAAAGISYSRLEHATGRGSFRGVGLGVR